MQIRIHDVPGDLKPGTYLVEVTEVRPNVVEYRFIGPTLRVHEPRWATSAEMVDIFPGRVDSRARNGNFGVWAAKYNVDRRTCIPRRNNCKYEYNVSQVRRALNGTV